MVWLLSGRGLQRHPALCAHLMDGEAHICPDSGVSPRGSCSSSLGTRSSCVTSSRSEFSVMVRRSTLACSLGHHPVSVRPLHSGGLRYQGSLAKTWAKVLLETGWEKVAAGQTVNAGIAICPRPTGSSWENRLNEPGPAPESPRRQMADSSGPVWALKSPSLVSQIALALLFEVVF